MADTTVYITYQDGRSQGRIQRGLNFFYTNIFIFLIEKKYVCFALSERIFLIFTPLLKV
jgi:hypothetical protein